MNRVAAASALVVAALAVSGCGTVPSSDAAATVGDGEVTVDAFEGVLQGVTANSEVTGIEEDLDTGTVASEQARSLLTLMVTAEASDAFLAASGEAITEEDRQAFLDTVPDGDPVLDLPDDIVQLLLDAQVGPTARARVTSPETAELEERYGADPASLGVVCVRHVQVGSEAEAQAALDEIAAGASIEDVARERSTETSVDTTGGALQAAADVDCAPLSGVLERFGPAFAEAATTSRAGSPAGPVESQFGWHVVEAQAFEDIAPSLASLFEQSGGELLFDGYLRSLDVHIDPRYGRWDAATRSVVAL